jgi:hypothetical protein
MPIFDEREAKARDLAVRFEADNSSLPVAQKFSRAQQIGLARQRRREKPRAERERGEGSGESELVGGRDRRRGPGIWSRGPVRHLPWAGTWGGLPPPPAPEISAPDQVTSGPPYRC